MDGIAEIDAGFLALAILCWVVFFAALAVLVVTLARRARQKRADALGGGRGAADGAREARDRDDSAGPTS